MIKKNNNRSTDQFLSGTDEIFSSYLSKKSRCTCKEIRTKEGKNISLPWQISSLFRCERVSLHFWEAYFHHYRIIIVNVWLIFLWKGRKIAISTEMNEGSVGRALPEEVLRPYTKIGPAQPNMRRTKALGNGHTFPGKWWKAQQQDCLSILFPWERGFSLADFIWQATDGRLMDPTRSCE